MAELDRLNFPVTRERDPLAQARMQNLLDSIARNQVNNIGESKIQDIQSSRVSNEFVPGFLDYLFRSKDPGVRTALYRDKDGSMISGSKENLPNWRQIMGTMEIVNDVRRGNITPEEGRRDILNLKENLGLTSDSLGMVKRIEEEIGEKLKVPMPSPIRPPMPSPSRPSSIAKESIDLGASLAEDSNVKDTTQSLLGSINWGALLDIFAQPAFLADNQSPVEAFVAASQQKQQREQVAEQRQALLEQEQAKAALAQANKERELEIKEAAETRLRQQAGLPPELKPATGTEIKTMYEMIQRDDLVIKNLKNNYKDTSNEFGKGHRIIELMASINKTYPGRKLEEIRAAAYNMLEAGKGVGSSSVNNDEFVEAHG